MNFVKLVQWSGIVLGIGLVLYFVYFHLQYFGDASVLGAILLAEVIVVCLWKYEQRFFFLLLVAFAWAGMNIPLQSAWTAGRWVVLSAGAIVGYIAWEKAPGRRAGSLNLIALFCVFAAFFSATVSPSTQVASLKALSLLLLFLYCASGARLAVLGREDRFFNGLLWGTEILVYLTAICYFGLGRWIWGNPNSLGASMCIGTFPILLWGWATSDRPLVKFRRLVALLLCTYLVFYSMERAGMVSVLLLTFVFCFCLHQYKLLLQASALVLLLIAVAGMLAPGALHERLLNVTDTVLYKGHRNEGVLGSRRTPWEKSISSIKEHPLFGTGYGTSPTGEDSRLVFGKFASNAGTEREHGSSYITIAEWVGLSGLLPFIALLGVTTSNVWKVCARMRRGGDPRHYSIPLAMVVLAGLLHASFEDWLFAVGSYLCVYFWVFAFLLADFVPDAVPVTATAIVSRAPARLQPALEPSCPTDDQIVY